MSRRSQKANPKKSDTRLQSLLYRLRHNKFKKYIPTATLIIGLSSCIATWLTVPGVWQNVGRLLTGSAGLAGSTYTISTVPFARPLTGPTATVTPTSIPDTPLGSILQSGEGWSAGNIVLILAHTNYNKATTSSCHFGLDFQLRNFSSETIFVSIRPSDINLLDNLGESWKPIGIGSGNQCPTESDAPILIDTVLPGNEWKRNGEHGWVVWYSNDFTSPSITHLVVTVNNILNNISATWTLPIDH